MSVQSNQANQATHPQAARRSTLTAEERYYLASQWQLMWQKFRRHKLAIIGGIVLLILYLMAINVDLAQLSPKS